MIDLLAKMAAAAYMFGTYSDVYGALEKEWVVQLALRPSHRPPPDMMVRRNGIVLVLQSASGSSYRYVTPDEFKIDQFCIELETPLDIIRAEIRITREITATLVEIDLKTANSSDHDDEENLMYLDDLLMF